MKNLIYILPFLFLACGTHTMLIRDKSKHVTEFRVDDIDFNRKDTVVLKYYPKVWEDKFIGIWIPLRKYNNKDITYKDTLYLDDKLFHIIKITWE